MGAIASGGVLVLQDDAPQRGGSRRRKKRFSGCLPMLVFVAIAALLIFAAYKYVVRPAWDDYFADPEDYPGPGKGEVTFVVKQGQSVPAMGDELEELDVVASAEAFVDAAEARDEEARGIQAGSFVLMKMM